MSFSVQVPAENIEWSGHTLDSVFAQRKNIANPKFLKMLADVVRFSRDADRLLADPTIDELTLGQLLEREGYGGGFTDWYLIPMGDAIWSTPPGEMLDYPAGTFLRFCDNHGLLHITGKPKWRSVVGGARTYVERASRSFSGEVHTEEPVEHIERTGTGVAQSATPRRTETYDAVVIASHPPQTLAMLGDPTDEERDDPRGVHVLGQRRRRTHRHLASCRRASARGPRGTGSPRLATSPRTCSCSPTSSTGCRASLSRRR